MENVKLKDENMTTGTEKERLTVSGICKIVYAIWQRDIWILPCERTGELETHPRTRKKDTINLLFSLIEEDKNLEYVEAIESNRATPVFHGTVDIPERIRRKAESCSTELIKSNFKNRIYRYLDENQRKYFWDGIQELVENTNIADDILRLGDFQGVQYESKGKDETVFCLFATSAIIFALSRSNDKWKINESNMYRPTATNILPEDIRQKYDPYTLTGRHSHSSALQFKLIKDGAFAPTVIFYSQEKALGYVRGKNLLITRIEYEPKAIRLCYRDAGAEGYTLRRVESRDINKIYEFVKGSHDEFREKVSWRGRNIEDMTLNGLKKEVWTGYAYFYSNGKPAAYVDYKLRVDSDIEMGVALRCGGDDAAMLHKAEPVRHKLRQAVTADTYHAENAQRHRHRNDDHQADVERQRQIKQRYCAAHSKHSRLHCIAQLDRTAENRAGVHKILRDKVDIPLFA